MRPWIFNTYSTDLSTPVWRFNGPHSQLVKASATARSAAEVTAGKKLSLLKRESETAESAKSNMNLCCFMASCGTACGTHFMSNLILIFLISEEIVSSLTRTGGEWFIFIYSFILSDGKKSNCSTKEKHRKADPKNQCLWPQCDGQKINGYISIFQTQQKVSSADVFECVSTWKNVCWTCVWPGFDRQSHDLLSNTFNIHHQRQPVFLDRVGAQGHLYICYTHIMFCTHSEKSFTFFLFTMDCYVSPYLP